MKTKTHDLTGMPVRFLGLVYVITGLNQYDMYDLIRFDAERRVWQRTSTRKENALSLGQAASDWQRRLRYALNRRERLHPWIEIRSKNARVWRRARAQRGVLKRFFCRIQARPKTPIAA